MVSIVMEDDGKTGKVFREPGLGYDGIVGYSPLAMAKNAVGLAIATEEDRKSVV